MMKSRKPAGWEHFDHQADIGVRGWGPTPDAALEQIACALTAVIANLENIRAIECVEIVCNAPDLEMLVIDWLNALLYEMATRHCLFGRFAVKLDGCRLTAEAWGEPVDIARHKPAVEVKGATFCALAAGRRADGTWQAQCVVDV